MLARAAVFCCMAAFASYAAASEGTPARPQPCHDVAPGTALQAALDAAQPGEALCLAAGDYAGPLVVAKRITLWGSRDARVVSRGVGSTIRVTGSGAALLGFRVDGSGSRFERSDAAVRVAADDTRVEGLAIENALFGILAERANRVRIAGNEIAGISTSTLGLRGDAIRLWEVRHSRVEGNRVRDARDIVAWYAPENVFAGNEIERGRYGIHFMYSHGCRVERNRFDRNVVGVFVMYSQGVEIVGNEMLRAAGAAGMGIGAKESGRLVMRGNRIAGNTIGIYLDQSPLDPRDENRIEGNLIAGHDRAIVIHGGSARNHLVANELRSNDVQVALEGGGNASAAEWRGNYYDDYRGYDLDRDGVGDLPHEQRSLAAAWTQRAPALALFRGTPALALAEWLGETVPLFRPETLFVDETPRAH
jgi:nitrous oxidase accessory protein